MTPNAYTKKLILKAMKKDQVEHPGKWLDAKLRKKGFLPEIELKNGLTPDQMLEKFAKSMKMGPNPFLRWLIDA